MPDEDRIQRLVDFVAWVGKHIEGDEKGEAQPFLDRLFIAFGHGGAKSAGAVFEKRIKRFDKHKGYADCVWDGVALIEMKKRGADLSRHVQQLTDYWIHLAPGRPAYSILCNFDEFWIFDFNKDMLAPVEKIGIGELAERYGALAFLFPTGEEPVFGDDHEAVTRRLRITLRRRLTASLIGGCSGNGRSGSRCRCWCACSRRTSGCSSGIS